MKMKKQCIKKVQHVERAWIYSTLAIFNGFLFCSRSVNKSNKKSEIEYCFVESSAMCDQMNCVLAGIVCSFIVYMYSNYSVNWFSNLNVDGLNLNKFELPK